MATDFQLLVAVVDWLNRDDNTGSTRLVPICTTRASSCGSEVSGWVGPTDCAVSSSEYGESIPFAGEAGQVVTVAGTSESYAFHLLLVGPSGVMADSEIAGNDGRTEIAGVTLAATGGYEVWAVDDPYEGPHAYTVRIDCSGP